VLVAMKVLKDRVRAHIYAQIHKKLLKDKFGGMPDASFIATHPAALVAFCSLCKCGCGACSEEGGGGFGGQHDDFGRKI